MGKGNVRCHIVLCPKERIDWKTQNYSFDLFRDPSDSVCVLTLTINIIRTRDGIFPIVTIDPLCGRGNIGTRWSIDF